MTGATLCSGIGAPEVARPDIDWRFCAEIEPFPCAVLAHYREDVPNLGNILAGDFIDRALSLGPLDVLVAGTPCQAFSVAGLRRSLSDDRGNLTLRFVEIIDAIQPGSVLWENVPGVLNTSDNAFGCFLAGLVGADTPLIPPAGLRWTDAGVVAGPKRIAAWRILDAQYCRLAQRRERVFVVASAGAGRAAEVLFERAGVQRFFEPSRGQRKEAASLSGSGADRKDTAIAFTCKDYGQDITEDCAPTLRGMVESGSHANGGGQIAVAFNSTVRRLTPRECERLQGFPDDYTLVPYRGGLAKDGPRYKALGNSMPVPVLRHLLNRIEVVA